MLAGQEGAEALRRSQIESLIVGLRTKEENLADLAADGAMPLDSIRRRLRDIVAQRERAETDLGRSNGDLGAARAYLDSYLELLTDPEKLYRNAPDAIRRKLNRVLFSRIYVVNDDVVASEVVAMVATLVAAERGWRASVGGGREASVEAVKAQIRVQPA